MNDQATTEADRNLNSQIRSAFNADSSLRNTTSSVNISSDNRGGDAQWHGGHLQKEKTDLGNRLQRMTGVSRVENNLKVSPRASSANPSGPTASR